MAKREQVVLDPDLEEAGVIDHGNALAPNWVTNVAVLWDRRHTLARVAVVALGISLIIAFNIPKRYDSTARIMPPENSNSGTAMLAALAGRSLGGLDGLGSLAASFLGTHGTSALFVDLLRSGTVTGGNLPLDANGNGLVDIARDTTQYSSKESLLFNASLRMAGTSVPVPRTRPWNRLCRH